MKKIIQILVLLLMLGVFMLPLTVAQDDDTAPEYHWWNDRVFYEIFVRSFYDSDGDGVGDLQGVISQLDYLNDGDPETTDDLGVTGIWLMPINPSSSYHGYDVTDYREINPDYGTLEDFAQLMEEAHDRGIAVIIDMVINHTSSQHPWFEASRAGDETYADWYIWEDENPGYVGPWGAPAWHSHGGRFYYGVFVSGMPDLNYHNPDVTAEMYDIARFWLDDVGVDGFRLDAAKLVVERGELQQNMPENRAWLADFRDFTRSVNPDVLNVGEVDDATATVKRYIEDGALDLAFEFDFAETILSAVMQGNKRDLERAQPRMLRSYPPGQYASFLTNHDQARVMTQLRGDVGANIVAASVLLTGPGVPFIYYGEEIGMFGGKPDPQIRTPMHWDGSASVGFTSGEPWEALEESVENVADASDDPASLLSHYRMLIHLRNSQPALQRGATEMVEASFRSVYSLVRYTDDKVLLIVINLNDEPVMEYSLTMEEGPLTSVSATTWVLGEGELAIPSVNDEGGFDEYTPVGDLPAHSTFIIRLES